MEELSHELRETTRALLEVGACGDMPHVVEFLAQRVDTLKATISLLSVFEKLDSVRSGGAYC